MTEDQVWVLMFLSAFTVWLAISAWASANKKDEKK